MCIPWYKILLAYFQCELKSILLFICLGYYIFPTLKIDNPICSSSCLSFLHKCVPFFTPHTYRLNTASYFVLLTKNKKWWICNYDHKWDSNVQHQAKAAHHWQGNTKHSRDCYPHFVSYTVQPVSLERKIKTCDGSFHTEIRPICYWLRHHGKSL